ncbi:MAG: hypothetical protein PHP69_02280 [Candidatus Omnitrophica bacterium]|nr:hypothetical protein [Candidatus Omnitrophota bacterium]MDD5441106.1 hypothetical protein [Candidatus Omnitrophota bacterium]
MKNIYKKKVWASPKVTSVKLNPEQAVLSCCAGVGRAEFVVSLTGSIFQCVVNMGVCADSDVSMAS